MYGPVNERFYWGVVESKSGASDVGNDSVQDYVQHRETSFPICQHESESSRMVSEKPTRDDQTTRSIARRRILEIDDRIFVSIEHRKSKRLPGRGNRPP